MTSSLYSYFKLSRLDSGSLTFSIKPLKLVLELLDEAADRGAERPQVDVGVYADPRPIGGLGRVGQRGEVLWKIERRDEMKI